MQIYSPLAKLNLGMNNRLKLKKPTKKHLKILGIIILILILPLTILLVRQVQNYRTQAALPNNLETEQGVLSSSGVTKKNVWCSSIFGQIDELDR